MLQEKLKLKEEREATEAKYKYALVDGNQEPVGNFRVEPPGLFRGRGEHPKMGKLKCRIYPRDITINIGKGVPIPEHPYPKQQCAADSLVTGVYPSVSRDSSLDSSEPYFIRAIFYAALNAIFAPGPVQCPRALVCRPCVQ